MKFSMSAFGVRVWRRLLVTVKGYFNKCIPHQLNLYNHSGKGPKLFKVKCKNLGAEIKALNSLLPVKYPLSSPLCTSIFWRFDTAWLYQQKWKLQEPANSGQVGNTSQLSSDIWISIKTWKTTFFSFSFFWSIFLVLVCMHFLPFLPVPHYPFIHHFWWFSHLKCERTQWHFN